MEVGIGVTLAVAVGAMATATGLERDRAFYPTTLIVVASYNVLFAIMAGGGSILTAEAALAAVFVIAAVIGFRSNLWIVVAALAAHGLLDFGHGAIVDNAGVPSWWPQFCASYDLTAAAYLAWRLLRSQGATLTLADDYASVDRSPPYFGLLRTRRSPGPATKPLHRRAAPLVGVVIALAVGPATSASAPDDLRFAQVDGERIAYRISGTSGPVVVLMAGLGDTMTTFRGIVPHLSTQAIVITYDRAGYGRSTLGAGPRDAAAVEHELSGLLAQTGVPGPYVLVGHSVGGMYAEYFAARNPDLVAGLILVDARPAEFTRICQTALIPMCVATPQMMRWAPAGARAEVLSLAETGSQLEAATRITERPVLIVSRSSPGAATPFDTLWHREQAGLAARYAGSTHRTAPSGGHYIHRDQETWFLAAVTRFLAS